LQPFPEYAMIKDKVSTMYCPYCHTLCGESDAFCYACGSALQPPTVKKGSRWVPLLLLFIMSAAGLILFFMTAGGEPIRAEGSSPWFYVQNGTLYFEARRYTGTDELTVPAEIAGQAVTALTEDCFADCAQLTTVYLPDTLERIGDRAFSGCTSLRGIYIPPSVRSIGSEAFSGCTELESVCLHSSMRQIGPSAFDLCTQLRYIIFRGSHAQWLQLYDGEISAHVGVFCEDGSFFHPEFGH